MTESMREPVEPTTFLPLSPQDLQVLLTLLDQPRHGYGIVKASDGGTGVPALELGSLYRIISRMMDSGLIEEVPVAQNASKRKRRYYAATSIGRQVARAEVLRLKTLLSAQNVVDLAKSR